MDDELFEYIRVNTSEGYFSIIDGALRLLNKLNVDEHFSFIGNLYSSKDDRETNETIYKMIECIEDELRSCLTYYNIKVGLETKLNVLYPFCKAMDDVMDYDKTEIENILNLELSTKETVATLVNMVDPLVSLETILECIEEVNQDLIYIIKEQLENRDDVITSNTVEDVEDINSLIQETEKEINIKQLKEFIAFINITDLPIIDLLKNNIKLGMDVNSYLVALKDTWEDMKMSYLSATLIIITIISRDGTIEGLVGDKYDLSNILDEEEKSKIAKMNSNLLTDFTIYLKKSNMEDLILG